MTRAPDPRYVIGGRAVGREGRGKERVWVGRCCVCIYPRNVCACPATICWSHNGHVCNVRQQTTQRATTKLVCVLRVHTGVARTVFDARSQTSHATRVWYLIIPPFTRADTQRHEMTTATPLCGARAPCLSDGCCSLPAHNTIAHTHTHASVQMIYNPRRRKSEIIHTYNTINMYVFVGDCLLI